MGNNVLRAIEIGIAEFNYVILKFTNQHPIHSLRAHDFTDQNIIDVAKYIKETNHKENDFIDFCYTSPHFPPIGKEFNKTHDFKVEESLKIKNKAFKESQKLIKLPNKKEASAYFELLNEGNSSSKHITISIGGMFTNNISAKWKKYSKTHWCDPVYSYKWSVKSEIPSWGSLVPSMWSLLSIKALFSKAFLAFQAIKIPWDSRKTFLKMLKLAEIYGKLLAHLLIVQFPFTNQSISLIGFEVGSQVVYSCLEELKKLKADNIIHNVYFIKGVVAAKNSKKWVENLKVVRGTIYNYYSGNDKTIFMFKTITMNKPIGMIPLLEVKSKEIMTEGEIIKRERFLSMTEELNIVNIDSAQVTEDTKRYKDEFSRILAIVGL
mmetsp:Transcript_29478/g.26053  ORF Transcript_29478/g.26053 Transcript_29478/m.26053 type:complete len:378 (-) Transcript_29478:46-1179(-)